MQEYLSGGTGLGSWACGRDSANFITTVHYLTGA